MKLSDEDKNRIEHWAEMLQESILENPNLCDLKDPLGKVSQIDPEIILIRFPGNASVSGFSYNIGSNKCIYINSAITLGRQYCTFWHEIYHDINDQREMKEKTIADYEEVEEEEAKYFSYCMVLPQNDLKNQIVHLCKGLNEITIEDLIKLQYAMRVSMQALLYRITELYENDILIRKFMHYTFPNKQEEFKEKIKLCGYSLDLVEPTNDFCLPQSFFVNVCRNIESGKLSCEKAEELMNLLSTKEAKWLW